MTNKKTFYSFLIIFTIVFLPKTLLCWGEKCTICSKEVAGSYHSFILPCCHVYHKECIRKKLKMKNCCPRCKKSVKKKIIRSIILGNSIGYILYGGNKIDIVDVDNKRIKNKKTIQIGGDWQHPEDVADLLRFHKDLNVFSVFPEFFNMTTGDKIETKHLEKYFKNYIRSGFINSTHNTTNTRYIQNQENELYLLDIKSMRIINKNPICCPSTVIIDFAQFLNNGSLLFVQHRSGGTSSFTRIFDIKTGKQIHQSMVFSFGRRYPVDKPLVVYNINDYPVLYDPKLGLFHDLRYLDRRHEGKPSSNFKLYNHEEATKNLSKRVNMTANTPPKSNKKPTIKKISWLNKRLIGLKKIFSKK